MRISKFIPCNLVSIRPAWEDFARTIRPEPHAMDVLALCDHAEDMVRTIAEEFVALLADLGRAGGRPDPDDD